MGKGREIVDRIKTLTEIKCLSVDLGIKPQVISNWKIRDTIPSADIALKIANYLNVSVEWLITGEEGEIPQEILDLAYEINALPEVYKNFIKADLAKYKSACVSLDEEKISNSS